MKKPLILFLAAFIYGYAINGLQLTLIFYTKERMAATATDAGFIVGALNLFYTIACLSAQKTISRIRPHLSIKFALSLTVIACALSYFTANWPCIYLCMLLCGISSAFFWPPLLGWLSTGLEGPTLARLNGIFNLCWSLGAMLSPILTGWLCDWHTHHALLIVTLVYFLLFLSFLPVKPATQTLPSENTSQAQSSTQTGCETNLRYAGWIGLVSTWFIVGFICSSYTYITEQTTSLSRTVIGSILLFRCLSSTVTLFAMGFLKFWQYNRLQMLAGQLLLGGCVLALGYVTHYTLLCVLMTLIGIFNGLNYLNSQFHGLSGSKDRTHRTLIHEVSLSIGAIAGGPLSGWIYEKTGTLSSVCMVCAALMLVSFVASIIVLHVTAPHSNNETAA